MRTESDRVRWSWARKMADTLGFSLEKYIELSGLTIKPPSLMTVWVENNEGIWPARDAQITHELVRISLNRLRGGKSDYWAAQVALRATGMHGQDARIERESDLVARLIVTAWE